MTDQLIAKCGGCGQKNRIPTQNVPAGQRKAVRCGKCKRTFTDLDLMQARIGATFGDLGVKRVEFDGKDFLGFDID